MRPINMVRKNENTQYELKWTEITVNESENEQRRKRRRAISVRIGQNKRTDFDKSLVRFNGKLIVAGTARGHIQ